MWLRRDVFKMNVTFSGYVSDFFFFLYSFPPLKTKKVYLNRLLTSLPLIILMNSVD